MRGVLVATALQDAGNTAVCQQHVHNAIFDADGTRSLQTTTLLARTSNSLALRMCTLAPCLELPADLGDGEFEKNDTVHQAAIHHS